MIIEKDREQYTSEQVDGWETLKWGNQMERGYLFRAMDQKQKEYGNQESLLMSDKSYLNRYFLKMTKWIKLLMNMNVLSEQMYQLRGIHAKNFTNYLVKDIKNQLRVE